MSSLTNKGGSHKWRMIRAQVLKRDPVCQMCGIAEATHADHIIPRRLMLGEAADDLNNLQGLCAPCNLSKGGRFFERGRTPMTPLDLFTPKNDEIRHYQEES